MKKAWAVLLAVLAYVGFAVAQINTTGNVTVAGLAPTQNTDGSTLTDLTSIRVFRKVDAGAYSLLTTLAFEDEGQPFTHADNGLANGTYCYQTTALNSQGNESAVSNEACRTVLVLFPRSPTNVTAN
jgi:hypothetical protein